MKGILLAGGEGTRLFPATKAISKQLVPVYDKPTIFYPLSVLMLSGIRDILIISTVRDLPMIQELLGTGENWGLTLRYKVQETPAGIAQAFLLAKDVFAGQKTALILGDNIFFSHEISAILKKGTALEKGACICAYHVPNPEQFGVVELDAQMQARTLEEKPKNPKSNWVVTGLYFYDESVYEKAEQLKPSARGELEITDLNRLYLEQGQLDVITLGRGVAWLDSGTPDSLLMSSQFVQTIEARQGLKIACLEEIAYHMEYINDAQLKSVAERMPDSSYGRYVKNLVRQSL